MSTNKQSSTQYHCDTLPEPQNLTIDRRRDVQQNGLPPQISALQIDADNATSAFDVPTQDELLNTPATASATTQPSADSELEDRTTVDGSTSSRERKLCVRHLRMADEGTLTKLQRSLEALPLPDRQAVNSIWSTFASSSHARRATILHGLVNMCCFSQLSFLTEQLHLLIRIDPFAVLPKEVALRVLGYLDAFSLCRAAQVSKPWALLANDDVLWHSICQQHIGHRCRKCGWGLPLMERKRPSPGLQLVPPPVDQPRVAPSPKRDLEYNDTSNTRPAKRQRSEPSTPLPETSSTSSTPPHSSMQLPARSSSTFLPMDSLIEPATPLPTITRPWKAVYYERLTIERNWRRGRCTIRTLTGHTDGVMCMQFSDNLSHPSFPILITGSYDRTARVWNLETGEQILVLRGHGRAVRTLQFDNYKLITGSMDRTLKVWNWRTGACIRTLEGHTEGVVCLNFDSNLLASGSVDATVKIWNFRTGECFTLRGHHDWVNSLQLWDSRPVSCPPAESSRISQVDVDPGKMLFSASDDGTIKLWDLTERICVRTLTGHVGQVQSIKLLIIDNEAEINKPGDDGTNVSTPDHERSRSRDSRDPRSSSPPGLPRLASASVSIPASIPPDRPGFDSPAFTPPAGFSPYAYRESPDATPAEGPFVHNDVERVTPPQYQKPTQRGSVMPILISGSLDNTVKIWDLETGKETATLFGHIEGIWGVAASPLRIVSASHDRTIKVWSREEGKCTTTLVGHRSPVTCLCMGDDKIVSGSDDGDIRVWNFGV